MREDYVVIKETKRRRVAAALISLDPAETRGLVQKCSRRIGQSSPRSASPTTCFVRKQAAQQTNL
jgi:hypothetical protein